MKTQHLPIPSIFYGACQNGTQKHHYSFTSSWLFAGSFQLLASLGIFRFFSCITQPYKHGSPYGCRWALHEKPAGVSVSIAVLIHFSFHQFITRLYLSHRVGFLIPVISEILEGRYLEDHSTYSRWLEKRGLLPPFITRSTRSLRDLLTMFINRLLAGIIL